MYAVLLALAILTMTRSDNEYFHQSIPSFDLQELDQLIFYPPHPFAPGLGTVTIARLLHINADHVIPLVLLLGLPIIMCWAVARISLRHGVCSHIPWRTIVRAALAFHWRLPPLWHRVSGIHWCRLGQLNDMYCCSPCIVALAGDVVDQRDRWAKNAVIRTTSLFARAGCSELD